MITIEKWFISRLSDIEKVRKFAQKISGLMLEASGSGNPQIRETGLILLGEV